MSCYDRTRESKATYQITEDDIVIQCGCQIRFFKGGWLKPLPMQKSQTRPLNDTGVAQVDLSADEARLLRLYKKVLDDYGLAEALRCNACYELHGGMDGCHAQVTDQFIQVQCRCSNRTFHGTTT